MDIFLSNTLNRKKELFKPINSESVGIYSCGPTVYWNQHIGHMFCYVHWDILVRFLRASGYKVKWVMNLTDVGHMTSDEDFGEDKMEKGAKREGVSVWEIADKYILQFKDSLKLFGIKSPDVLCRATENIQEQIDLAKKIEKNGFTYITSKGLVYDTAKFKDYARFADLKLEKNKVLNEDLEIDREKKLPWDFFLWAINPKHLMKWPSPWGEGYPGWHLECTAMSVKFLGGKFDIHTGGIEHIKVHHSNEIAQGFGAFGHITANYWLHNGWLTGKNGEKMSKSLGNYVTAQDLQIKGYDPLSARYLIMTAHYKKGLGFSFESLDSAQKALENARRIIASLKEESQRNNLSAEKEAKIDDFRSRFFLSLADDINTSQALAVFWEMLKSNIPSSDKYDLAKLFDEILGLDLFRLEGKIENEYPPEVQLLIDQRNKLRQQKKFQEADEIREQIVKMGYQISDQAS